MGLKAVWTLQNKAQTEHGESGHVLLASRQPWTWQVLMFKNIWISWQDKIRFNSIIWELIAFHIF